MARDYIGQSGASNHRYNDADPDLYHFKEQASMKPFISTLRIQCFVASSLSDLVNSYGNPVLVKIHNFGETSPKRIIL